MSQLSQSLMLLRRFSTSKICYRPALGANYKSKDLWEERFNCDLLGGDQNLIKSINTKILSDSELTNLEVDVFINIAAPRRKDFAQLQEAVKTLRSFRKSLGAHTLLPSTSHAICRLFLDSERLPSLVKLLENRVEFGIFPDPFVLNIMFDEALQNEQYALASRLAALIMLQEEFGLNALNDNFALYSVTKYIESRTDFSDWTESASAPDLILNPDQEEHSATSKANDGSAGEKKEEEKKNEDEGDEDEEEEDAEYIRVPFLRNPYTDNHFDLKHPRQICGKTLSMLGMHLNGNSEGGLGARCQAIGDILQAKWTEAHRSLDSCVQSKLRVDESFINACKFYLENANELNSPDDQVKQSLLAKLEKLTLGGLSLSAEADARHAKLKDLENEGINELRRDLMEWSKIRFDTRQAIEDLEARKRLIEDIKAKKRELKHREEYLFFYDNLKKKNLARIEYD